MSRSPYLGAIALVAIVSPAFASVDASVTGIVEDALLHPLAGAVVVIHDESGTEIAKTITGKDGRFSITGVPVGAYTIEATHPGLVADHQHIQLASSQALDVELVLVDSEEVITIDEDWSLPAPSRATGSAVSVGRTTLEELPGGDSRPITSVMATQAGFVQDALGAVYVRGHHGNVQYQIDGVPVPDSVGGMFAASIPVRLIQSLEIITGGMPAEYGNRLGAVVNLVTRAPADRPEGDATIRYGSFDTVEPGATYAAKLTDRTGVVIGGSFMYSERALEPPTPDPLLLHDTGYTGRVFTRVDYQPCDVNRYELFAMYAHNHFQIPYAPAQPDRNATESEHEAFGGFAWTHKLEHGQLLLAPIYKLSTGALRDFGGGDVVRRAQHFGGIAAYSWQRGKHLLKTGAQTDFLHANTRFTAGNLSGRDHTQALLSGAYVQDRITFESLALDVGMRVDELHVMLEHDDTDDKLGVSPRVGLSNAFTKDIVGRVFGGVLWIPPAPLDAANAARALGVVPADEDVSYDLRPETDLYAETGLTARLSKFLSAGITVWGRYAYNQLDDTAIGSTSLDSNYNFERGQASGIEASADLRIGAWLSAFANGSVGFAQGRGIASAKYLFDADALANDDWQTLDHAQTFTANAGATLREGRLSLTGVVAYGSGLRTGPENNKHVPGHVKADVSMRYTFVPHEYPFTVGIDVENVFDARYAYRIANGFVGSSYAAPRTVYLSLSVPLAREPHD